MAQTQRPRRNNAGVGGSTAVRGGVLVVGAIVVGIFLMVKGGGGTAAAPPGDQIGTTTTSTPAATTTPSSSTPSATLAPAQVKIIAANGSTVKGLAGKTKTQLAAAGYTNVTATDTTPGSSPVTTSVIYFVAGAEADAKAVARAAGFSADRVTQLPTGAQIPVASVAGARVIMILGPDSPAAAGSPTAPTSTTAPRQATTTTVKK